GRHCPGNAGRAAGSQKRIVGGTRRVPNGRTRSVRATFPAELSMPTVAEAFAAAADSFAQGNLAQADQNARAVVGADPGHADAWHMLGLIAWQSGEKVKAMDCLQRSVALSGGSADAWKTLGDMHA